MLPQKYTFFTASLGSSLYGSNWPTFLNGGHSSSSSSSSSSSRGASMSSLIKYLKQDQTGLIRIKKDQLSLWIFKSFGFKISSKLDFFIEYSCSRGASMSSLIKYLKQDQTGLIRIKQDQLSLWIFNLLGSK